MEKFLAEYLLNKRQKIDGSVEYLVKWKGYPIRSSTWEPAKQLEEDGLDDFILAFEEELQEDSHDEVEDYFLAINEIVPTKRKSIQAKSGKKHKAVAKSVKSAKTKSAKTKSAKNAKGKDKITQKTVANGVNTANETKSPKNKSKAVKESNADSGIEKSAAKENASKKRTPEKAIAKHKAVAKTSVKSKEVNEKLQEKASAKKPEPQNTLHWSKTGTHGCKFEVVFGDIKRCKADAFVVPTNSYLAGGAIANLIQKEAGTKLADGLATHHKQSLALGQVLVTDAHLSNFNYLVHVHIPMFNTPMSKMILQQAISNVLLQSSSQINIKTLVLPSLGTGNAKFPLEEAAEILFNTVLSMINILRFGDIEKITLVVHEKNRALQDAYKSVIATVPT